MNILIVNASFTGGGAEKVARQLFYGFHGKYEINTFFMAGRSSDYEYNKGIERIYHNPIAKAVNRAGNLISNNARIRDDFSRNKILSYVKKYNIDIVHFHNIHGNYIGISDIAEVSRHCKVVWTLHDMWALTGHCAYSLECNSWIYSGCKSCSNTKLYPQMFIDTANNRYNVKKKNFVDKNIVFVSPSKWLINQCNKTFLSKEQKVLIHNGVDTDTFCPLDKREIRNKYNISKEKIVLLFAANGIDSPYKGMDVLEMALELVEDKEKYELVVVGNGSQNSNLSYYNCCYMGYINNDKKMNELYNLADVFILPSRAENFPCSILESMSAGTPVIASAIGGIIEQVDEKTGWLFEVGKYRQLAQIINLVSKRTDELQDMGVRCRKRVEDYFSEKKMLKDYQILYQEIEGKNGNEVNRKNKRATKK